MSQESSAVRMACSSADLIVRERAERHRLAASFRDRGGDDRAVAVVDAAGTKRLAGLDQFVAGREHGDARPPHDFDAAKPHAASMPISREPIGVPLRSKVSPRAISEPA